ncbi:hypothetical protein EJB05_14156, partial [Eragrostis curvula]
MDDHLGDIAVSFDRNRNFFSIELHHLSSPSFRHHSPPSAADPTSSPPPSQGNEQVEAEEDIQQDTTSQDCEAEMLSFLKAYSRGMCKSPKDGLPSGSPMCRHSDACCYNDNPDGLGLLLMLIFYFAMEVFFKAIMGEIVSLVDKYSEMTTPTMKDKKLHNLERLLLRVSIIIDEAEGRTITNQAIVHQLNLLRKEMYHGYFIMDSMRSNGIDVKGPDVSRSFALSKLHPSKRIFFTSADTHTDEHLQQVVDNLNNIIEDTNGLVMFLKNYPTIYKQPYSMHLFIGKCMFGRQMEMERIMDFLVQKEHPVRESVGVLPIVGPIWVGKSTIVAHVCNDPRVRNYFSHVMMFTEDDINNDNLCTMKDLGVTKGDNKRILVVIELSGDVDEVAWNTLYSSYGIYLGRGSRIIITSRSNQVKKFGTTQALVLNFLPPEAYWYFFKVLTFGSAYSSDHPELESIAMEIARGLMGSFISAYITSGILQSNFNSQYWWMYLASFNKHIQRNFSKFGVHPYDPIHKGKPITYQISDDVFAILDKHRECPDEKNVPVITAKDLSCSSSVYYEGEFDFLLLKSHIPPYKLYILSCAIEKSKRRLETS